MILVQRSVADMNKNFFAERDFLASLKPLIGFVHDKVRLVGFQHGPKLLYSRQKNSIPTAEASLRRGCDDRAHHRTVGCDADNALRHTAITLDGL